MMYDKRRHTHGNRSPRYSPRSLRPNPLSSQSRCDEGLPLMCLPGIRQNPCRPLAQLPPIMSPVTLLRPVHANCATVCRTTGAPDSRAQRPRPGHSASRSSLLPVDNVQLMQVIAITTGVVERWRAPLRSSKGIEKSNKRSTARDSRLADAKEGSRVWQKVCTTPRSSANHAHKSPCGLGLGAWVQAEA
jgi:hypothetical protein